MLVRNPKALGNCFEAAVEILLASPLLPTALRDNNLYLCHGVVTRSQPPFERMGHAWIEESYHGLWFCRDALFPMNLWTRDFYYSTGQVKETEVIRYPIMKALTLMDEHGHCGPWDKVVGAAACAEPNE